MTEVQKNPLFPSAYWANLATEQAFNHPLSKTLSSLANEVSKSARNTLAAQIENIQTNTCASVKHKQFSERQLDSPERSKKREELALLGAKRAYSARDLIQVKKSLQDKNDPFSKLIKTLIVSPTPPDKQPINFVEKSMENLLNAEAHLMKVEKQLREITIKNHLPIEEFEELYKKATENYKDAQKEFLEQTKQNPFAILSASQAWEDAIDNINSLNQTMQTLIEEAQPKSTALKSTNSGFFTKLFKSKAAIQPQSVAFPTLHLTKDTKLNQSLLTQAIDEASTLFEKLMSIPEYKAAQELQESYVKYNSFQGGTELEREALDHKFGLLQARPVAFIKKTLQFATNMKLSWALENKLTSVEKIQNFYLSTPSVPTLLKTHLSSQFNNLTLNQEAFDQFFQNALNNPSEREETSTHLVEGHKIALTQVMQGTVAPQIIFYTPMPKTVDSTKENWLAQFTTALHQFSKKVPHANEDLSRTLQNMVAQTAPNFIHSELHKNHQLENFGPTLNSFLLSPAPSQTTLRYDNNAQAIHWKTLFKINAQKLSETQIISLENLLDLEASCTIRYIAQNQHVGKWVVDPIQLNKPTITQEAAATPSTTATQERIRTGWIHPNEKFAKNETGKRQGFFTKTTLTFTTD